MLIVDVSKERWIREESIVHMMFQQDKRLMGTGNGE